LLHAPAFATDTALDIHIRTLIRYSYSYISAAAVKIGDDILMVASFGDYYLNGVFNAKMPSVISGYPVTHSNPSKHEHSFSIGISGNQTIVIKAFKDLVSVRIHRADKERFQESLGMMGDYEEGKMRGRDRTTIFDDVDAFAAEWQVRENDDPLLFPRRSGPQYPEACKLPDAAAVHRRLSESPVSKEAAEEACAGWPEDTREACVYDVMVTGDLWLAAAGPI